MSTDMNTKAQLIYEIDMSDNEKLLWSENQPFKHVAEETRDELKERLALARSVDLMDLQAKVSFLMDSEFMDDVSTLQTPEQRVLYSLFQDILAMPSIGETGN